MRFIVEGSECYRSGALMSNGVDLGVNAETERSFSMHVNMTLCVYVHVWISGFFVLVYWHPGLFVPAGFVSLLGVPSC